MKKDALSIVISGLVTFGVLLALVWWRAPSLFERSTPIDLQLVAVDEAVPPFFEGVFRPEDHESEAMILRDPYLMRARPFFPDRVRTGPHDLLGFRNRGVPNLADVVAIGDSQTYGINATLEGSWPERLAATLGPSTVYSMAVGGWGPAEYYGIFDKALRFRPRVVIVAVYTGNDPLNAFVRVKGQEHYREALAPEENLDLVDPPRVSWPPPKSEWWELTLADGSPMTFTPKLRYASHQPTPAARLGLEITELAITAIAEKAEAAGVELVLTLIPTKELALRERLRLEGVEERSDYADLVRDEGRHLRRLAAHIESLGRARYAEVVGPLQEAAARTSGLYPADADGHPLEAGYAVIAETLAEVVRPLLPELPEGLLQVEFERGGGRRERRFLLLRDGVVRHFASGAVAKDSGWDLRQAHEAEPRQVLNLPHRGSITDGDPARFGPLRGTPGR